MTNREPVVSLWYFLSRVLPLASVAACFPGGCKKASTVSPGANDAGVAAPSSPSLAALEVHDARMTAIVKDIADTLNGVGDEASARAAGPKLRDLASSYAAAGRLRLQLIAVLDTTHKAELNAYLNRQTEEWVKQPLPLEVAIDKAVKGPFAVQLRGEIDAVLNANLEHLPARQKQRAEEEYRRRGWRH
jgi:hypothetical protein